MRRFRSVVGVRRQIAVVRRSLGALAVVVAANACEANVQDAPVSFGVPQATPFPYDNNHRQSETTIVTTSSFLFPLLVVAYNDSSLAVKNPTADYTTGTYQRGWTELGWSTSADSGVTWDYRGQVSPFLVNGGTNNSGASALTGDPSAAVDPHTTSVVYLASMGVSDQAWNQASGGTNTIVFGANGISVNGFTATSPIELSDSLCVAKSSDGGISFTSAGCIRLGATGVADRTSLTVDGNGFIWASSIRTPPGGNKASFGKVAVFRSVLPSDPTAFVEMPPPVANVYDPVLRRDLEGNVWIGAQGVPSADGDGSVWLQEFDIKKSMWVNFRDVALNCGKKVDRDTFPRFGFSAMRNAHPYDFDFGLDDAATVGGVGTEVMRIAFEQTDPENTTRHLIQVAQYPLNLSACSTSATTGPSSISTTFGELGTQFMPSLNYAKRGVEPYWSLVYLTTAQVKDEFDQYIYPAGGRVVRNSNSQFPREIGFTPLAPTDWYACLDGGYWGDYFGVTQVRDLNGSWWNVSAFTSSRPAPPCVGPGPQHVAASRW